MVCEYLLFKLVSASVPACTEKLTFMHERNIFFQYLFSVDDTPSVPDNHQIIAIFQATEETVRPINDIEASPGLDTADSAKSESPEEG